MLSRVHLPALSSVLSPVLPSAPSQVPLPVLYPLFPPCASLSSLYFGVLFLHENGASEVESRGVKLDGVKHLSTVIPKFASQASWVQKESNST
jgi:hypothetical protein